MLQNIKVSFRSCKNSLTTWVSIAIIVLFIKSLQLIITECWIWTLPSWLTLWNSEVPDIWNKSSNVWSWYKNMRKWWTSRRSWDVYYFRMFPEHDQTPETSVLYDFSNSLANRSAGFFFNCGSHLIFTNFHMINCKKINRLHDKRFKL